MNTFNLNQCKYDFASDTINIFANIYDKSGSMDGDETAMRKANIAFKQDFSRFEERGSVAIARADFESNFSMSSFDSVENFDVNYSADGGTALYDAIIESTENTIKYYNEIVKRLNVRPRITYLVFSDGEDNDSCHSANEAREAIKTLNSLDATTVFVAFGEATRNETGAKLGFSCTRNIDSAKELISCMGNELSKSCKEQSKSAFSLKSEFFSKVDDFAEDDDVKTQSVLEDDFFSDILI